MTRADKLRKRLLAEPNDFSWDVLCVLMKGLGFEMKKTGGSGRKFTQAGHSTLFIHEPHPGNILKRYQVQDALHLLKQEGFL